MQHNKYLAWLATSLKAAMMSRAVKTLRVIMIVLNQSQTLCVCKARKEFISKSFQYCILLCTTCTLLGMILHFIISVHSLGCRHFQVSVQLEEFPKFVVWASGQRSFWHTGQYKHALVSIQIYKDVIATGYLTKHWLYKQRRNFTNKTLCQQVALNSFIL